MDYLVNNSSKLKYFKLDSLKNSPDKLSLDYMFNNCSSLKDVEFSGNPRVGNPTIHLHNILSKISEESLKFFVKNIGDVKNNPKYIGAKITVSSKTQISRMSSGFGDWMRNELSAKGWNLEIK